MFTTMKYECKKEKINTLLNGGDLRSISGSNEVVMLIHNQEDFDILFSYLYSSNRLIVMRAADSIEKISRQHSIFLDKYKTNLLELITNAADKELKWHLAQIVSKLNLNGNERNKIFEILKKWTQDKNESKIVRVNSIQTLSEISCNSELLSKSLDKILNTIEKENISSINARIKKLRKR